MSQASRSRGRSGRPPSQGESASRIKTASPAPSVVGGVSIVPPTAAAKASSKGGSREGRESRAPSRGGKSSSPPAAAAKASSKERSRGGEGSKAPSGGEKSSPPPAAPAKAPSEGGSRGGQGSRTPNGGGVSSPPPAAAAKASPKSRSRSGRGSRASSGGGPSSPSPAPLAESSSKAGSRSKRGSKTPHGVSSPTPAAAAVASSKSRSRSGQGSRGPSEGEATKVAEASHTSAEVPPPEAVSPITKLPAPVVPESTSPGPVPSPSIAKDPKTLLITCRAAQYHILLDHNQEHEAKLLGRKMEDAFGVRPWQKAQADTRACIQDLKDGTPGAESCANIDSAVVSRLKAYAHHDELWEELAEGLKKLGDKAQESWRQQSIAGLKQCRQLGGTERHSGRYERHGAGARAEGGGRIIGSTRSSRSTMAYVKFGVGFRTF